ncbi:hypothetical protein EUX98_g5555 [Antrodiella citrinella]|uniref:ER membrane protein complex subunit 2 n=1 Tax=Antrodiella citrinella TaxID=2447956 RepID=A0A4S4MT40_9APHY|nr:hypothetical protein EUX98_g5555 [Antrodiella citrinella]
MEVTAALQKLAAYEPRESQRSQRLLEEGQTVLKNNAYLKRGDEGWETLEKLALAALDQGDIEVANKCLKILSDRFPESSRVDCLTGIRIEVTETPEIALSFYDSLLEGDATNAAFWRRKAAVYRKQGKTDLAVKELSTMLDTYYTEVEGWLELADIYSTCQQYTYALQSLSHTLLLAPQNPVHFLLFAETAYLAADVPLALKMYLQVVDMTDDDDDDVPPIDSIPTGLTLRAWYGVKLCTQRLTAEPRLLTSSASQTAAPAATAISSLDDLATERLRTADLNLAGDLVPKGDSALIGAIAKLIGKSGSKS